MPGFGTISAIFVLKQIEEKYSDKKKDLYSAVVNLEKVSRFLEFLGILFCEF